MILSILSIFMIAIFAIIMIVTPIWAIDNNEPIGFIFSFISMLVLVGLILTHTNVSTQKLTMIVISKENITKEKGVYGIRFFKNGDKVYKTSQYSDVEQLESFDTNEFQKICIKYTEKFDIYGVSFSYSDGDAVISQCEATEQ